MTVFQFPSDDRPSSETLAKRIEDAQSEISASLAFYTPKAGAEQTPEAIAYARDRLLQSMVVISEGLASGFEKDPVCEVCGEPIAAGARYISDEDGCDFHPGCVDMPESDGALNDTAAVLIAELPDRMAAAKAYLAAGGAFADAPQAEPVEAAPPVVEVRALEWDGNVATTPFGSYVVVEITRELVWRWAFHCSAYSVEDETWFRFDHEAKAAAQADYEARIRSALSPTTITAAEHAAVMAERDQLREKNARLLQDDQVEWIVNDIAELGVKIGDQFFFLYKGESLVYQDATHDDGTPMYWRHVGKREFGECAHPINYSDPTKIGTVSIADGRKWQVVPPAGSATALKGPHIRSEHAAVVAERDRLREALRNALEHAVSEAETHSETTAAYMSCMSIADAIRAALTTGGGNG